MSQRSDIDWRTPAISAWQGSEASLQSAVVASALSLAGTYPEILLLHAIPNGDWRGWGTGLKLQAQGVIPGIPDLFLPVARHGYYGLYIELKKAKGTVKPVQWQIMTALAEQGYCVRVSNHLPLTLQIITDYLKS